MYPSPLLLPLPSHTVQLRIFTYISPPPGFCRTGRNTPFFANTIACIRQTCTANQPFDPVTLLTPWQEHCRNPVYATIIANANALATQDSVSNSSLSDSSYTAAAQPNPSPSIVTAGDDDDRPAANNIVATAAASTTHAHANVITTTFLGIATDANGQLETLTVPALVGFTETIFGNPVTRVTGTVTPTSIITLPWPTLPVGYFSAKSSAARSSSSRSEQATTGAAVTASAATVSGTASTTGASTSQAQQTAGAAASGRDGGTVLDSGSSEQRQPGAKSLLGLMVVLLVSVAWF
ncbi:MAG: hypothetical protein Q9220_006198 [cf. Caloplaca sp. 1 TL-2023]